MIPSYTGNGAYCYADSLHMSLLESGADAGELPEPGFLECLTTMPFGTEYLRLEDGPLVFFNSPAADPDTGLSLALGALGWTCKERYGSEDEEKALALLLETVRQPPVLAGPLEMRFLTHIPGHDEIEGADHFVLVLAADNERILVHDPGGYPCVPVPTRDFLLAWRADDVPYRKGPYKLRSGFGKERSVSREEAISRTLPIIAKNLRADFGGPIVFGGERGLRLLAEDLRTEPPNKLRDHLTGFALPLAARRSLDASRFLREAERPKAARNMESQALLFGEAQYHAVQEQWSAVAGIVERLAGMERDLASVFETEAIV